MTSFTSYNSQHDPVDLIDSGVSSVLSHEAADSEWVNLVGAIAFMEPRIVSFDLLLQLGQIFGIYDPSNLAYNLEENFILLVDSLLNKQWDGLTACKLQNMYQILSL